MEIYTISKAYPWLEDSNEITIYSDETILYSELGVTHSGCQSINQDNNELIREKCGQIADLIREIDKLNKL